MSETQAQLEMCFPPSFFDIMEHLMIHMVEQITEQGPMYFHQMWTYERFMSVTYQKFDCFPMCEFSQKFKTFCLNLCATKFDPNLLASHLKFLIK
jgi:hypothetical protein